MAALYFEDVEVGATFAVGRRIVTESDLQQFAAISGDHHPIHTDDDFARKTPFGRRIAHGPFGIAIAIGLFGEIEEFQASSLAMVDVRDWSFRAPIYIGDELSLRFTVVGKRLTRSGKGIVDRQLVLLKSDGTVAQEGFSGLLIATRSQASKAS